MSKHARDRRPYIKPVTRLELSESNIKLRWIAIAVLLAIAVVSIGYGFYSLLSIEPGWQEVRGIADEVNCGSDFQFQYDFGAGDVNPTAQYRKLESFYGQLTESAFHMFSSHVEGTDNLYHLNTHVNEAVTVAEPLYQALEQIVRSGSRYPFLGPVTVLYEPVFLSAGDAEAAVFDPMKNEELSLLAAQIAAYCNSPEMISLELLGESTVRLNVAEEYLAFAQENGIETFLDLGWMTNAFIIDYMADALAAQGFVYGYLSSFDGFTRNLDIRGESYSQNIFHCTDNTVSMPAVLEYYGPVSLVTLRNYPMSDRDRWNYYAYADGSITTVFLDPRDGASKSSIDGVTAYSSESGCAQILLRIAPLFTTDVFDAYALESLENEGFHSVYCQGKGVIYTEENASLTLQDPAYKTYYHSVKLNSN